MAMDRDCLLHTAIPHLPDQRLERSLLRTILERMSDISFSNALCRLRMSLSAATLLSGALSSSNELNRLMVFILNKRQSQCNTTIMHQARRSSLNGGGGSGCLLGARSGKKPSEGMESVSRHYGHGLRHVPRSLGAMPSTLHMPGHPIPVSNEGFPPLYLLRSAPHTHPLQVRGSGGGCGSGLLSAE